MRKAGSPARLASSRPISTLSRRNNIILLLFIERPHFRCTAPSRNEWQTKSAGYVPRFFFQLRIPSTTRKSSSTEMSKQLIIYRNCDFQYHMSLQLNSSNKIHTKLAEIYYFMIYLFLSQFSKSFNFQKVLYSQF